MIKLKKYKKNDKVEVWWLDAHFDASWLSADEASTIPDEVYCKSVGYFTKYTKDVIVLSTSIGEKKKSTQRDRNVIPLGMVRKIHKLR